MHGSALVCFVKSEKKILLITLFAIIHQQRPISTLTEHAPWILQSVPRIFEQGDASL